MDEELRAIRAQELAANEVYGSLSGDDEDVDPDWFVHAMNDIASKK